MPFMTSPLLSFVVTATVTVVVAVNTAAAICWGGLRLTGGCDALGCSPVIS